MGALQEAVWRRLCEEWPDALWIGDPEGKILFQNQAAERLVGHTAAGVANGLHFKQLCAPEFEEPLQLQLKEPTGNEKVFAEQPFELLHQSGQRVRVALRITRLQDGDRDEGVVLIARDLRERQALEAQLAEAKTRLEQGEQKMMLAALAGAAAHELNQPLTSIMGYSELLRRKVQDDDPMAQSLDIILQESTRMADLVRKIGRVTRFETKSYLGGSRIVDLERAVDED